MGNYLWRRALLSALLLACGPALADAVAPTADAPGAADTPLLKRYEGSFIVTYSHHAFGELNIPLSPLVSTGPDGQYDSRNNRVYKPEQFEAVEGDVTRLVYVIPEGRSPLEVLRNYEDEITAAGGEVLFDCKAEECGGDANRASYGGGNKMSLTQYFFYDSDIKDPELSTGHCAVSSRIDDQRFLAGTMPQDNGKAWVAVQTYQLNASQYCKAINGRTIAIVHVVMPEARENNMVLVTADEMAKTVDANGSIALYGIYFDTAEASLKPDSAPTLAEIAAFLAARPDMAVLVVGHTDSQGSYDYNLDLSARRAAAVKTTLAGQYGIDAKRLTAAGAGMMAPVASNSNEAGRAKNRRVTLVPMP
jgi:OOP family OmpA-OmpF porin